MIFAYGKKVLPYLVKLLGNLLENLRNGTSRESYKQVGDLRIVSEIDSPRNGFDHNTD